MNENRIIETLKYISQFVENKHDEGLGDYLHIVIGRTDINVIDETIYLLERKQKEIVRYKKEIEEKSTIIMAGAEKVKQLEEEIEELKLITRQYNSYCINTDDDEPRIILAHKHYFDSGVFTSNFISKDKIREKLETERIKALDRFDNKLDVTKRIYKRNVQVALIDKLKKELLEES